MKCPKCDEGTIAAILFKESRRKGYLCDRCGTVWLEGEPIDSTTGHIIQSLTQDEEVEYTFIDIDKNAENNKSVFDSKFK